MIYVKNTLTNIKKYVILMPEKYLGGMSDERY